MDPISTFFALLCGCGCPTLLLLSIMLVPILGYRRYSATEDRRAAEERNKSAAERLAKGREPPRPSVTPAERNEQHPVVVKQKPPRRQPPPVPVRIAPAEITPDRWDARDEHQLTEPESFGTTPKTVAMPRATCTIDELEAEYESEGGGATEQFDNSHELVPSENTNEQGEFDEIGIGFNPDPEPKTDPPVQQNKPLPWWQSLFYRFSSTPPGGTRRGQ